MLSVTDIVFLCLALISHKNTNIEVCNKQVIIYNWDEAVWIFFDKTDMITYVYQDCREKTTCMPTFILSNWRN